MKQVAPLAPIALVASFFVPLPTLAAGMPGEYSFTASIGESSAKHDSTYGADQTISFAVQYQKTNSAAYRATVGLMSLTGREAVSPSAGTRDADAFFLTGDIVFTPRFRVMRPFALVGVGFYDVRLTDNQGSQNGIEAGVNWGFGLDVQILRWFAVHGDVSYHYLTGDVPNPIQVIVIGGRFDF
jgi:outer membrane protein with beta-barrel domain